MSANLDNTRIYAFQTEKDNSKLFLCPCCNSEVILHKGEKVVHHFKHKNLEDCNFGGESKEHLEAKFNIYTLLKQNPEFETVEIEKFFGTNIADVYCETEAYKLALEIQRSTIPIELVKERSINYSKKGINTFWILLEEDFEKQKYDSINFKPIFRLKKWQIFLLHIYNNHFFVYDPNKLRFKVYKINYWSGKTLKTTTLMESSDSPLVFLSYLKYKKTKKPTFEWKPGTSKFNRVNFINMEDMK